MENELMNTVEETAENTVTTEVPEGGSKLAIGVAIGAAVAGAIYGLVKLGKKAIANRKEAKRLAEAQELVDETHKMVEETITVDEDDQDTVK